MAVEEDAAVSHRLGGFFSASAARVAADLCITEGTALSPWPGLDRQPDDLVPDGALRYALQFR